MNIRIYLLALLTLFLIPTPSHAMFAPELSRPEKIGIGVVVLGGVALIAGLISWLIAASKKSDQEILGEGQQALANAERDIQPMLPHFQAPRNCTEELLYDLAQHYSTSGNAHDGIMNLVNLHDSLLSQSMQALMERIVYFKGHPHPLAVPFEAVYNRMEALRGTLNTLRTSMHPHRAYFVLYTAEVKSMQQFAAILECYNQYGNQPAAFKEQLKGFIACTTRTAFPFADFVDAIDGYRTQLMHAISACYGNYPNRVNAAQSLVKILQYAQTTIACDDLYTHQLHMREQARLERERIEAERRKARALEDQARAAHAQAAQMAHQNRLKNEENNLKRVELIDKYLRPTPPPQLAPAPVIIINN